MVSPLRIAVLGLLSLALAIGVGRFAFTPLLPIMRADGIIDIAGGGRLAAVHFAGYWLGAVTASRIPLAPRTHLGIALIGIGICTLAMGLTDRDIAWSLLRFLAGIFSAWTLVLVGNYFIKNLQTSASPALEGWVFAGVGAGILLAGLASLGFMQMSVSSPDAWLVLGGASLALAIVICVVPGPEMPARNDVSGGTRPVRSPLDLRAVTAYGAVGLGYVIPATYLPVMAREILPESALFGWSWPVFGLAAALSTLLVAPLRRRYSDRGIWAACQVILAGGLLLPVAYPHIATIIASGLCVGGTFMVITMTGMKEAHRRAHADDVMRHIAALTGAFAAGQVVGPVLASSLYAVAGDFSLSLVAASALTGATAVVLITNGHSAPRAAGHSTLPSANSHSQSRCTSGSSARASG